MPALLYNIAGTVVFHVVQLICGCLAALAVYLPTRGKTISFASSGAPGVKILIAASASLCGILLPLGIYGVMPLIAALLAVGFQSYTAGALLVSNVMFNMLVPFNDPSFIWKTGYRQAVFAFIAGLCAGILLLAGKKTDDSLFRQKNLPSFKSHLSIPGTAFRFLDDCVKKLGIFLVVGVTADVLFQRYALGEIIGLFYVNSFTASIPMFFGTHNISNPFFLLTFAIIYLLMNLVNLSALSAILKIKGLAAYLGYYALWALILAIPAFI